MYVEQLCGYWGRKEKKKKRSQKGKRESEKREENTPKFQVNYQFQFTFLVAHRSGWCFY